MNVISPVLFLGGAIIFQLVKWILYYGIWNCSLLCSEKCVICPIAKPVHTFTTAWRLILTFNIFLSPVLAPNWSLLMRFSNHNLILPGMVCVADISHPLWPMYRSSTRLYPNSPSWQVCPIQPLQINVSILPYHQPCDHVLIHCTSLLSGASYLTLYSLGYSDAYANGSCELTSM